MAPSQTDFDGSGTSRSGSKSWRMPRPSHAGHIPCGLLKLKSCGLGGSKPIPQVCARVVRGEQEVGPPLGRDDHRPLAELQRLLDGLGQPPAQGGAAIRSHLQPVDHDLDVVLDLPVERQVVGQVDDLSVDPGPQISGAGELGEEVLVFPLLAADDRRQDQEAGPYGHVFEDPRDDLLAGLGGHRPAAVGQCPCPTRAKSTRR